MLRQSLLTLSNEETNHEIIPDLILDKVLVNPLETQDPILANQDANPNPVETQKNNPLHGITLEQILVDLEAFYGWKSLGEQINIRCFQDNPSIKSSLKFLRKTPWARTKVEQLYIKFQKDIDGGKN